jgi:hypothetical protein
LGGGGGDDPGDADDKKMQELEEDLNLEQKGSATSSKKGDKTPFQSAGHSSTPVGSRKVVDWASLFQNAEENLSIRESEHG